MFELLRHLKLLNDDVIFFYYNNTIKFFNIGSLRLQYRPLFSFSNSVLSKSIILSIRYY